MNEMIQEAILDRIDSVEEAAIFAEFDVVMSMAEVYTKSAFIAQESSGIEFDGFVIQEADSTSAETKTDEKKTYINYTGKSKIIGWITAALNAIIRGVSFIITKVGGLFKKIGKKKNVTESDVRSYVVDHKYEVELDQTAQEAFNLPAKPTVRDFQVRDTAKDNYKAKDRANRQYNKTGMSAGGSISVDMSHVTIKTVIPGVDMNEFAKAADWFYRAATIVDQEIEELTKQKEPAQKFAKFAIQHGKDAFKEGASSTVTSYEEARKIYEEQIEMKLVEGNKKLAEVKKQLKEYADADIKDPILVHIRERVSRITVASNVLTKKSMKVKEFVESILTPEQHVARRERLMKEVEDEERWTLDDPKAGFIEPNQSKKS